MRFKKSRGILCKEPDVKLVVVIDLFSRTVVGWASSSRIRASLVCMAYQKAVQGGSHHQEYCCILIVVCRTPHFEYRRLVQKHAMVQSISRRGNCWDLKASFVASKLRPFMTINFQLE